MKMSDRHVTVSTEATLIKAPFHEIYDEYDRFVENFHLTELSEQISDAVL